MVYSSGQLNYEGVRTIFLIALISIILGTVADRIAVISDSNLSLDCFTLFILPMRVVFHHVSLGLERCPG